MGGWSTALNVGGKVARFAGHSPKKFLGLTAGSVVGWKYFVNDESLLEQATEVALGDDASKGLKEKGVTGGLKGLAFGAEGADKSIGENVVDGMIGEGTYDHISHAAGNAVDAACNLLFRDTWTTHPHSGCMHLVTDGTSFLQLCYLAWTLHSSLVNNGLDEFHAGSFPLLRGMDARHVHELNHRVMAVGRQEVYALACSFGLLDEVCQSLHRHGMCHATLCCQVRNTVNTAEPNDVLNVDVVANEVLPVIVNVDDASQAFAVLPIEVKERAVLTEAIYVAGIVGRRVVVAHEQDDARTDSLFEQPSPLDVSILIK